MTRAPVSHGSAPITLHVRPRRSILIEHVLSVTLLVAFLGAILWFYQDLLLPMWTPAMVVGGAIAFAVVGVNTLRTIGVASQRLTVTFDGHRLDVHERRPVDGDHRLTCELADVQDVELWPRPLSLLIALHDGRSFTFLVGRPPRELHDAMCKVRAAMGFPSLADVRAGAVRAVALGLEPEQGWTLDYASGALQLFQDPEGTGVVIRLPYPRRVWTICITPALIELHDGRSFFDWPLDQVIDVFVDLSDDTVSIAVLAIDSSRSFFPVDRDHLPMLTDAVQRVRSTLRLRSAHGDVE